MRSLRHNNTTALSAAAMLMLCAACSTDSNTKSATAPPPQAEAPKPAYFQVDAATAGAITGKVTFAGKPPARTRIQIDQDKACLQLNPKGMFDQSIALGPGGGLANAFVYVKAGLEGKQFAPPAETEMVTIDQHNCNFAPRMIGIRAGQVFQVTNSDPLTHNIHPMPEMNRDWNQSQPQGAPALERKFVRPEMMIRIKCNVHSWMRATVNVMEHPYFAVTAADGTFTIANLPPGDYTLEALHEKMAPREMKLHVDPSGRATANIALQSAPPR